jgi:ABC-type amino acid transport substrate-binding protein
MTKWTEKIQGLLNGEIDAVLGCVAVTKERLKVL